MEKQDENNSQENILEENKENENQKNDENVLSEVKDNVLEELPNPNKEEQNEINKNENIKENLEKNEEENKENEKQLENIEKQEINNNEGNNNENQNIQKDEEDNNINEKQNNIDNNNNLNEKGEENNNNNNLNENNENVLQEVNENKEQNQKEDNILAEVNENNNMLEQNDEEKNIKNDDNIKNKIIEGGQNKENPNKILDDEEEEKEDNEKISIKRNLPETDEYDRSLKVILLGDSNVGKSSLINRLINNNFCELQVTIGIESHSYIISFNEYLIRMQIWDTAGQEKFNSIVSNYYKGTDVGIFIYSIDNQNSFNDVKDWYRNLKENSNENSIYVLLGNKKDLEDEKRAVTYEQGENFAVENEFMLYREMSCKSKEAEEIENILEVFDEIGKYFYDFYKKKRNPTTVDMNYVATASMIALGEKQRKKQKNNKSDKKCCSK